MYRFHSFQLATHTFKYGGSKETINIILVGEKRIPLAIQLDPFTSEVPPGHKETFQLEEATPFGKVQFELLLLRQDSSDKVSSKSSKRHHEEKSPKRTKEEETAPKSPRKTKQDTDKKSKDQSPSDDAVKIRTKKIDHHHHTSSNPDEVKSPRKRGHHRQPSDESKVRVKDSLPTKSLLSDDAIGGRKRAGSTSKEDPVSETSEPSTEGEAHPRPTRPTAKHLQNSIQSMSPSRVKGHRRQGSKTNHYQTLPLPHENEGEMDRQQKYKSMDGIVGRSEIKRPGTQHDSDEKATTPKFGSLKFSQVTKTQVEDSKTATTYKQHYLDKRSEEDQNFLFHLFFTASEDSSSSDAYSLPQAVFYSLIEWNLHVTDVRVLESLVGSSRQAIKSSESSRKQIFTWISNMACLLTLTFKQLWIEDSENNLKQFMERLQDLLCLAFDVSLQNLRARTSPREAIAVAMSKAHPDISKLLHSLREYKELAINHFLFPTLHRQFWSNVFRILATDMRAVVVAEGSANMNNAIKLKMMVGQIEDWVNSTWGKEMTQIATSILEPVREIANVLTIGSKEDLIIDSVRSSVCPSLQPAFLHDLLKIYKPELSMEKPISSTLLNRLLALATNAPKEKIQDFGLNFDITEEYVSAGPLQLKNLPTTLTERPGFAFLRAKIASDLSCTESEHW